MSDVSPLSSVSQGCGGGSEVSLCNPVTSEYTKLIETLAKAGASPERLTVMTENYLKSYYAAYHASVRRASVTVVSDASSSSGAGSSRWANSKLKKGYPSKVLGNWRKDVKPESAETKAVEVEGGGYCYAPMLREPAGAALIGPWPIVADLLELRLEEVDLDAIERLRVDRGSRGFHVGSASGQYSLHEVLASAACQVVNPAAGPASLYAYLRTKGCELKLGSYFSSVGGSSTLSDWLVAKIGEDGDLPHSEYELAQSSAALLREDKKIRLRSLEALGDAAISLVLAQDNYKRGESVQRYQDLRSRVTNNKVLADTFVRELPEGAVAFAGAVDPKSGVVGAKALEAIVGAVWVKSELRGVAKLLRSLNLVEFCAR